MDKQNIINIIAESFDTNPSVNWVIKNDRKRKKRIRALADYSFETAKQRNGVFISSDDTGVALCYKYNTPYNLLKDVINQVKLVFRAVGIFRIGTVLERESKIKSMRPANGEFLYFWFFGVNDKGRGGPAAYELKDLIFEKARLEKLPIYVETSVARNKKVYERFGFETYHTWELPDRGISLFFMKREF